MLLRVGGHEFGEEAEEWASAAFAGMDAVGLHDRPGASEDGDDDDDDDDDDDNT